MSCLKIQENYLSIFTAQENYTYSPKIRAVKTNIDFDFGCSDIFGRV